jgi:hypothetical protein
MYERTLEAAIGEIRDNSIVMDTLAALVVGEINLLCQIFRAAGVLIGLAERAGITPPMKLPALFQYVLSPQARLGLEDSDTNQSIWRNVLENKALNCTLVFALALRNGIMAVLPQTAWQLRSLDNFKVDQTFFVHQLRMKATYADDCNFSDLNVHTFWLALNELTYHQVWCILNGLSSVTSLPINKQRLLRTSAAGLSFVPSIEIRLSKPTKSELNTFVCIEDNSIILPLVTDVKIMRSLLETLIASLPTAVGVL